MIWDDAINKIAFNDNVRALNNFFSIVILDSNIGSRITDRLIYKELTKHYGVSLFNFSRKKELRLISEILFKIYKNNMIPTNKEISYINNNLLDLQLYASSGIKSMVRNKLFIIKELLRNIFNKKSNFKTKDYYRISHSFII
jgi:hypothetical protein